MEQLGINTTSLLIQMANFGLLVFLLQKFLYKPVMHKIDERNAKIAASLAKEEELVKKAESLDHQESALLKKAKEEAHQYLAEAKKEALSQKETLLKEAKNESQALSAKIESQQAAALENMKKQLKSDTAAIAAEMVRTVLANSLTESDQHTLIAKALTNLKKAK